MVRRPTADEVRAGLLRALLVGGAVQRAGSGGVQEDGFGLEELAAAGKAEQRRERVAGSEERDNEDVEHCLAYPELRFVCVESRQDEVSRGRCWLAFSRLGRLSYPHRIIHDAASAMKRQYQGSLAPFALVLLSRCMYRLDPERKGIEAVATGGRGVGCWTRCVANGAAQARRGRGRQPLVHRSRVWARRRASAGAGRRWRRTRSAAVGAAVYSRGEGGFAAHFSRTSVRAPRAADGCVAGAVRPRRAVQVQTTTAVGAEGRERGSGQAGEYQAAAAEDSGRPPCNEAETLEGRRDAHPGPQPRAWC
jgi:hypothetical protein